MQVADGADKNGVRGQYWLACEGVLDHCEAWKESNASDEWQASVSFCGALSRL